jgi:hypothetical protein
LIRDPLAFMGDLLSFGTRRAAAGHRPGHRRLSRSPGGPGPLAGGFGAPPGRLRAVDRRSGSFRRGLRVPDGNVRAVPVGFSARGRPGGLGLGLLPRI